MFQELGDGVFRRRYESLDLNVGVVVGDDGILIVDTRASHPQAREVLEELKSISRLPVRWVVNTHFHWDHTFGNAVFADAQLWGHEKCAQALRRDGEEMKLQVKASLPPEFHSQIDDVVVTPPDHTFATSASLAIGRTIEMAYHGLAHTDSDIVVRVPDSGVAFFGDIVEEGAPPSFGDSFPRQWAHTLRQAANECPDVVVPGHGDIVDEAFVLAQAAEIEQVVNILAEGSDLENGPFPTEVMRSAASRLAVE